jgi:hypothetical protein
MSADCSMLTITEHCSVSAPGPRRPGAARSAVPSGRIIRISSGDSSLGPYTADREGPGARCAADGTCAKQCHCHSQGRASGQNFHAGKPVWFHAGRIVTCRPATLCPHCCNETGLNSGRPSNCCLASATVECNVCINNKMCSQERTSGTVDNAGGASRARRCRAALPCCRVDAAGSWKLLASDPAVTVALAADTAGDAATCRDAGFRVLGAQPAEGSKR